LKSQMPFKLLLKRVATLNELDSLAQEILSILPENAIVLLNGNLATGKTTFVNKLTKILNLNSATSPTFSLQQIYSDKLFHYDFYRVNFEEVINLGLIDEFEKSGLHFVEWAMDDLVTLLKDAGFNLYSLDIKPIDDNSREYILKALNA